MKKYLLAITVGLLSLTVVNAQTRFGIKAGLNLFKLGYDGNEDDKMKAGLHVGGLANFSINDQWAVQPEIFYSMQGSNFNGDFSYNLNYINIPVLMQFKATEGLRIQAGLQLGILLTAKGVRDGNSTDIKDSFASTDIALPLGLSYVTESGFGVDARYHLGVKNLIESASGEVFNRGFQLGVFYFIR